MGQYLDFIIQNAHDWVKNYLKNIMICVMDTHVMVQEAACTSFSKFVENGSNLLMPYIKDILHVFSVAFEQYKGKTHEIHF